MRTVFALAFVAAFVIAGCSGKGPATSSSQPPLSATAPKGVQYQQNGTALPLPSTAVLGTPHFAYLNVSGPEPNIGATADGSVYFNAYNDVLRTQDGGKTWKTVHQWSLPVVGGQNSDPMFWADYGTGRIYQAPMFPILLCASIEWSDDHGETWTQAPAIQCGDGAYDHQKLASGVPGPDANPAAGKTWPAVLYMCYNGVQITSCAMSYDGGQSWPLNQPVFMNNAAQVPIPSDVPRLTTDCSSGQNGRPTVAPNGVVVVPRGGLCPNTVVGVSRDSGATWKTFAGPDVPFPSSLDPALAFTPDNTMYMAVADSGANEMIVARSTDMGQTWSAPFNATPPGVKSISFVALSAGDDGRIALAFLGSRDTERNPNEAPDGARYFLYIVTSEDANAELPHFTSYQVTPDSDPVQIGSIHQGGGGSGDRNLLDFIDSTVAADGTYFVAYADGCTGKCIGNPDAKPGDSRDDMAAAAWLTGWSLYGPDHAKPATAR